ncbi:peptidoglycan-binding domain-containing protein [Cellulomonas sp. NS3]|uniref:peptidoglycan-binding domain-containing protein n=1 Tax=Cellulomonas sp. NS3 TaxID=2973977 RepID=UPI0021615307|nr:peptidoglycan-binding domain-containing protein [Cellulomonas sp. NS3]
MKRIISGAATVVLASLAAVVLPTTAQAAGMPACDYAGQQSTYYYAGSVGVNAWTSQPMASWHPGYAATDCYVHRGASGPEVVAIQSALNTCHGAGLVVDGIFGRATESALFAVQASRGIGQDGRYGPQTRDHMSWDAVTSANSHSCWHRY